MRSAFPFGKAEKPLSRDSIIPDRFQNIYPRCSAVPRARWNSFRKLSSKGQGTEGEGWRRGLRTSELKCTAASFPTWPFPGPPCLESPSGRIRKSAPRLSSNRPIVSI